jgi:membrane protein
MPVRTAFRIVMNAQVTDLAASLAYYAVLCIFPTMTMLVALLGLIGSGGTAQTLLDGVGAIGPKSAVQTLSGPINNLVKSNGAAGVAALISFALALWAASGYVGGFIRGANRILGVEETRSTVGLRAVQLRLTLIAVLMIAAVLAALALSGPILDGAASSLGVGDTAKTLFEIARWPAIALAAGAVIAIMSRHGPNVDHPPVPWRDVLPGTAIGLFLWLAASGLFGIYVATLGSYSATYAGLAGPVVLLIWLWLSNLALLVGVAMQAALAEKSVPQVNPPSD